jgi:toxin ParE1/3/4
MRLRFSNPAEADIREIGEYIARDDPKRALSFVEGLQQHCRKLIIFPEGHPERPEWGDGVRMTLFGRYVILYVVHDDILEIRRVIHGARNIAAIVNR